MDYIDFKYWIKGYISALEKNESISKEHIQGLIDKLREMISDIEENLSISDNEIQNYEDDLPF